MLRRESNNDHWNDNWLILDLEHLFEHDNDFIISNMFQVNQKWMTEEFIDSHNSTYSLSLNEKWVGVFKEAFIVSTFNSRKGTIIVTESEI